MRPHLARIHFSSLFPYLSHPLLIFSFENIPAPFPGRFRNALQHKINTKKLKPSLVAFYDIQLEYGADVFSREKISKEKVKKKGYVGKHHTI